jgi:pre-mRNA-splicing factor CWC26
VLIIEASPSSLDKRSLFFTPFDNNEQTKNSLHQTKMSRPLDHSEYLRLKYLEGGDHETSRDKKKRKRKRPNQVGPNLRIIDNDIDLNNIQIKEEDVDDMRYSTQEEKPLIAGIIDERPFHLQRSDIERGRWKTIEEEPVPLESSCSRDEIESSRREQLTQNKSDASSRRKALHDSDSDLSPQFQTNRRRNGSDSDLSPPRRSSEKTNELPVQPHEGKSTNRRRRHDSDSDISPPRSRDDKESKSCRGMHYNDVRRRSKERRRYEERRRESINRKTIKEEDDEKQTLLGKVAGLSDSKSVRRELEELRSREKRLMESTGDEALGRNARTVYRDRGTGHIRDMEAEASVTPDKDEEERQAKYKEWSRGLKQREDQKIKAQEDLKETDKPLARYEDDEDRDKYLKDRELKEDPMLQFMRKKRQKEEVKAASAVGQVLLVKPKYSGPPPPPNRFGIIPGYRWDGVDRSNGFERKLTEKSNETIARQEEAYRWGTEDM